MTRLMDMVSTIISMVPCTKDTGETISNTEKVKKAGQTVLSTKATTWLVRSMVLVCTAGMMEASILATGAKIRLKGSEHTAG